MSDIELDNKMASDATILTVILTSQSTPRRRRIISSFPDRSACDRAMCKGASPGKQILTAGNSHLKDKYSRLFIVR